MANSKIKQILVGSTTYDIEDSSAAHLSTDNTFTGINIFHKEETATSGDKTISEAKIDPGPTAPLILLETKTVASDGLTITGDATIRPDSIVLSNNGAGYTTSITYDGFTADYSGVYTKYYTGSIVHNTGSSNTEQILGFPDKSGTFAITDDIDVKAAGNNTFTGTNEFRGGTAKFTTLNNATNDPLASVSTSGIMCKTISGTTYYKYGIIEHNGNDIFLPSKSGGIALTDDIDVTAAGNNTFTGTNKFQGGNTYFRTASDGPNDPTTTIDANGVYCQVTGSEMGTHYQDDKIKHKTFTLTLPFKAGLLATTDDIKIKSATLSGTTLSITLS